MKRRNVKHANCRVNTELSSDSSLNRDSLIGAAKGFYFF